MMGRKPRDSYLPDHERKTRRSFSRLNKFEIIREPSEHFPIGGFFGRYDFLMSLSGEVWPEGLIVRDHRRGEAVDELMVHYKNAEREGHVEKFLVSTETGWAWRLNANSGFKLVSMGPNQIDDSREMRVNMRGRNPNLADDIRRNVEAWKLMNGVYWPEIDYH